MQHLLAATDFSETAGAAFRKAIEFANLCGGKITLIHVIYAEKINETLLGLDAMEYLARSADEPSVYKPNEGLARLREAAETRLHGMIAGVDGRRPDIDPVVVEGRPSKSIAEYASTHGVDLIVVGTHGRGTLGKAFLGSVADNVIRQAECPVMVVRK